MLETLFDGNEKVDRILSLTEKMDRIGTAISRIKYDDELVTEVPQLLAVLGAARDALKAELKTI